MRYQLVGAGKGCSFRPVDNDKYRSEFERIFGEWKPRGVTGKTVIRDRHSTLDDKNSSISQMMKDGTMVRMIREGKANDPGLKREAEQIERERTNRPRELFFKRKQNELRQAIVELKRSQV